MVKDGWSRVAQKIEIFFQGLFKDFQGPQLFFKDPSWNVMLLI